MIYMYHSKPSTFMLGIHIAAPRRRLEFLNDLRGLAALYVAFFRAYLIATFSGLNASSIPKVAQDAAISISSANTAGLTPTAERLLPEPALREEMRGKSPEQVGGRSWQKVLVLMAEAYHYANRQ